MRRKRMWPGVLAALVLACNASAISVDGNWNDWFSYAGTSDSNWNQDAASGSRLNSAFRFGNDSDYDADGGQNYDIEQIFYYYQDADANTLSGGVLYIGMITGYEPTNSHYRSGDMFVGLGCDEVYDLAVGTATGNSRYEDTWTNNGSETATTSDDWHTSHVSIYSHRYSDPYRIDTSRSGETYVGQSDVAWLTGVGPGSQHNFLEIGINLTGAQEAKILGGIRLHWTMECGNDEINVCDCDPLVPPPPPPPPPPNAPVPEPATMVLLGMGAAGMALRARRTAC